MSHYFITEIKTLMKRKHMLMMYVRKKIKILWWAQYNCWLFVNDVAMIVIVVVRTIEVGSVNLRIVFVVVVVMNGGLLFLKS